MSTALTANTQQAPEVLKKLTPKKSPHLTRTAMQKRDRRLVKIILANPEMPHNEAMIKAGFSKTTANKQAKRTVERSSIQVPIVKALDKAGVNEDSLAEKIKGGLDCQKVISATVIHKDNNGKTEQIDDFIEVPDNPSQARYVDMSLKLLRSYPDTSIDVTVPIAVQVNVIDYSKVEIEGE